MGEWRVDPDGVMGVVAGLDELGPAFEASLTATQDAGSCASLLSIDGRTTLSDEWASFMAERSSVPGKVMFAVCDAARSLGEAVSAVVAGAEDMSANSDAASARAYDEWNIASPSAYTVGVS